MLDTPFPGWPHFTPEESEAVSGILLSNRVNYWTGTEGKQFEKEFAAWVGSDHAVALANGTVALELALRALDVGPGHEVVVTPRTFFASASAIVAVGARPMFADVDPDSQNITAETIRPVLTSRTRAIMCVHLAGWPCDMDPLQSLARDHGLKLIEDCAQAHGATYHGRSVGSMGNVGAWSFCQDKIMTTGGEGGMVTTSEPDVWSRVWSSKDHGKTTDAACRRAHKPGFRWLHESFGTNARMIEIQAAIGRIQLGRMTQWETARRANAARIWSTARQLPGLRAPVIPEGIEHAAYKAYVFVEPQSLKNGWNRDRILGEINARGVPCYSGSCSEIYLEKAFEKTGWRPSAPLPVARELGETSLMFLVHPTLTSEHLDKTCSVLEEVAREAVR